MNAFLNSRKAESTPSYGLEVGEHVFVDGRDGEFIIVEVDRHRDMLQILPVGRVGRIERVPAASVRIVMPPKSKDESKKEVDVDSYGDPTAA